MLEHGEKLSGFGGDGDEEKMGALGAPWRCGGAAGGIAPCARAVELEKLDIDKLTQLKQTSILYDADGERVGSLYGSEHRVYVTLDAVPLHVQQAFLAAEDQRFYETPAWTSCACSARSGTTYAP